MKTIYCFVYFEKREGNPAFYRFQMLEELFSESGFCVKDGVLPSQFSISKKGSFVSLFTKIIVRLRLFSAVRKSFQQISFAADDVLFLHTLDLFSMFYLRRKSRKKHVSLVFDCVEWASPSEKRLGILSPSFLKNELVNSRWINRDVRVISISRYLDDYFRNKRIRSVRIPNLIAPTTKMTPLTSVDSSTLSFVFAGYPRKKDLLALFLDSVCGLPDFYKKRIKVYIAGPSASFYHAPVNCEFFVCNHFSFLGPQTKEEIAKLYSKCDFSILIRNPRLRVCKAGFPTKLVESLSLSTPVFCNFSSDLDLYLTNGFDSFVIPTFSAADIQSGLSRLLDAYQSDPQKIRAMKKNAFLTSQEYFLPSRFVSSFLDLVSS